MTFEMVTKNWAKNLPRYQEIYKTGFHTAVGMTPYDCHLGLKNRSMAMENSIEAAHVMINRSSSKRLISIYNVGEMVLRRTRRKQKIRSCEMRDCKETQRRMNVQGSRYEQRK